VAIKEKVERRRRALKRYEVRVYRTKVMMDLVKREVYKYCLS